jgi:hypothetical protein
MSHIKRCPEKIMCHTCATSVCVSAQRGKIQSRSYGRASSSSFKKAEVDPGKVQAGLRGSVANEGKHLIKARDISRSCEQTTSQSGFGRDREGTNMCD